MNGCTSETLAITGGNRLAQSWKTLRSGIVWRFFLFIFLASCTPDYKYEYRNKEDVNNTFIVSTSGNRERIVISIVYQNQIEDNLYYVRVNNEFYQCDNTFAKSSIVKPVQFSTIKEYKCPSKFKTDRLIIKKENSYYVTINNMTDYNGTISLKYFYDKDYKIFKIQDRNKIYTIEN